jgi:hypothetical protein
MGERALAAPKTPMAIHPMTEPPKQDIEKKLQVERERQMQRDKEEQEKNGLQVEQERQMQRDKEEQEKQRLEVEAAAAARAAQVEAACVEAEREQQEREKRASPPPCKMCCPNADKLCLLHQECKGKGGACTNKPGGCIECLGNGKCKRCHGKGSYKKPNGDTVGCAECYDPGYGIKRDYNTAEGGKCIKHVSWSNLSSRLAQYERVEPKSPRGAFRWSALACVVCPVPPLYHTTTNNNMSVGSTQEHSAGSVVDVAKPISAEIPSAASAVAIKNATNARAKAPGR